MGGWRINFGKKDYMTIKKQKGSPELNAGLDHCLRRIRENVDEQYRYGEFILQDGNCPLLREGKCGLQMEKGAKVLPFVCRTFPRTETPMPSGHLERSLTPACEGVLSLLWDLPEGVEFRSDPLEKSMSVTYEDGTSPLYAHFQEIRELCIDILQDRRRPLPERILLLGMALKPLADGETDVPAWLERSRVLAESGETACWRRTCCLCSWYTARIPFSGWRAWTGFSGIFRKNCALSLACRRRAPSSGVPSSRGLT